MSAPTRPAVSRARRRLSTDGLIAAGWIVVAAIIGLADSNFGSWHEQRVRYVVMRSKETGAIERVAGPFADRDERRCRAKAEQFWPQAYCVALSAKEVWRYARAEHQR
jgi:hypothetical protein